MASQRVARSAWLFWLDSGQPQSLARRFGYDLAPALLLLPPGSPRRHTAGSVRGLNDLKAALQAGFDGGVVQSPHPWPPH